MVTGQPWFEETEDQTPAVLISQNKPMSAEQIERLSEAAKAEGVDYSTTVDGRGAKFLHFSDQKSYLVLREKARRIAAAAGLNDVTDYYARTNLNGSETYLTGRVGQVLRGTRDQDGGARPSDLFRRAVDHLLVPYAKAVGAEGYRFAPERFGALFGLSEAEVEYLTAALRPASGKALSTVPIVTGKEKIEPPRSKLTTKIPGVTKNDLMWTVQNSEGDLFFMEKPNPRYVLRVKSDFPGDVQRSARCATSAVPDAIVANALGAAAGLNPDAAKAGGGRGGRAAVSAVGYRRASRGGARGSPNRCARHWRDVNLLDDDTLTQGDTVASFASHSKQGGGQVASIIADRQAIQPQTFLQTRTPAATAAIPWRYRK
jgi:hypothetical protein